jgi:hypothetical protein
MPDNVVSLPLRGKTYLSGPNRTPDSTATSAIAIEGIVKSFKDMDYTTTSGAQVKTPRSAGEVVCILVRNDSGVSLLPKMAVTWKSGFRGKRVDGYADFSPDRAIAGIVDEFLPSTGVAANDYFWLTVKGPTLAITGMVGDETNVISVDDWLINLTAAASTHSTTAGRVGPAILPAAGLTTNITFAQSNNIYKFARAMSAKTTANTNANLLVYVDLY